ncbi:MAG TPA: vanadium-dependent haloperoxidase [Actinoplanes sp.]|nr:vanadium-dependent haloperoxidase [Actinoplanes sp.]
MTGPTVTSRALGVAHTAMYDAWAAYDPVAKGTRLGSTLRQPAGERTLANKAKAMSYAAYKVLNDLFPDATHKRKAAYDAQMAALGYPLTDTSAPATVGNRAAQAVIDYRHNDGSNQLKGYADTTGYQPVNTWDRLTDPWRWQPQCVPLPAAGQPCTAPSTVQKPLTPQWGNVKPFSALLPSQYRVTGPAKNPDGTYRTADVDQEIADASNLDDVKKVKAEYWADGPRSVFPPGHDFIFAQALSRKRGHTLDTDVKFFFMLGNAMMDAGYASWWQKYRWDFVRPTTAIRYQKRGQLVNSWLGPNQGYGMVPAEQWRPYQDPNVVTPAFPEYVSGHSTFSAAGATVLAQFTGSDSFGARVTIAKGSSKFENNTPTTDITLTWPSFSAASDEAGWSRRYGGIHFRTGDEHGRALGRQVAVNVYSKCQEYFSGRSPG